MATLFEAKWWTTSRTMWFNLLVAILGIAEQFTGILQSYIPVDVYAILTAVLLVGNLALRVLTQIKLTVKKE